MFKRYALTLLVLCALPSQAATLNAHDVAQEMIQKAEHDFPDGAIRIEALHFMNVKADGTLVSHGLSNKSAVSLAIVHVGAVPGQNGPYVFARREYTFRPGAKLDHQEEVSTEIAPLVENNYLSQELRQTIPSLVELIRLAGRETGKKLSDVSVKMQDGTALWTLDYCRKTAVVFCAAERAEVNDLTGKVNFVAAPHSSSSSSDYNGGWNTGPGWPIYTGPSPGTGSFPGFPSTP